MGMVFSACTLSEANLRKVMADPPLVLKVLSLDDPEQYERGGGATRSGSGFFARLFGRGSKAPPPKPDDIELAPDEVEEIDLDKSWHGLHYLLTGDPHAGTPPLDFIQGGTPIGDVEVGLGPARAFTPAEVREIDVALRPIDAQVLASRFDGKRMRELDIYPAVIWTRKDADDNPLEYIVEFFEPFKEFIARAASRNMALVVYLG